MSELQQAVNSLERDIFSYKYKPTSIAEALRRVKLSIEVVQDNVDGLLEEFDNLQLLLLKDSQARQDYEERLSIREVA